MVQNVPASGKVAWCSLQKNGKVKKLGQIKVHLSFVFEKDAEAAFEEHKHLLYITLMHEVQLLKVSVSARDLKFYISVKPRKVKIQEIEKMGTILLKNEEISRGKVHTNTRKLN